MKRILLLGLLLLGVLTVLYSAVRKKKRKGSPPRFGAPIFQYNFRTMETLFQGNGLRQAWVKYRDSHILADKIFWNRKTEIGRCYDRVRIIDKKNDIEITGGVAWYYSREGRSLVRRRPVLHFKKSKTKVRARELVRYAKKRQARAIRDVVITSERGTARGQLAVYDLKLKTITLTGEPVLEQKGNVHRARKIVLYQKKKQVVLIGRAVLMQGRDRVKADRIVLIDKEPKEKKGALKRSESKKKKKNRLAFFYGNVRIYRYHKNGALDSITTGGYGEYFQKRSFARMMVSPKMIMAGDNTIVHGAVMEQFQDRDLAVVKGNVSIVKKYRRISGQLARYYIKKKKIYLTGNPLITEYGDSYRADVVVFDIAKDMVRWTGQTIAVIGVGDQNKKAEAWRRRLGIEYGIASGSLGRVRRVVGETFLSRTGKPLTNANSVTWGKLATKTDRLASGFYMINHRYSGWCDFILYRSGRFRFRGPGRLRILAEKQGRGARGPMTGIKGGKPGIRFQKRLPPPEGGVRFSPDTAATGQAPDNDAAVKQTAGPAKKGELPAAVKKDTASVPLKEDPVSKKLSMLTKTNNLPSFRDAASILLETGRLYVAGTRGKQLLRLPYIRLTNRLLPLWINAEEVRLELVAFSAVKAGLKKGGRRRQQRLRAAAQTLPLQIAFSALQKIRFSRTNDSIRFRRKIAPFLKKSIRRDRLIVFNREEAELIDRQLETVVSNQREISATMTNTPLLSVTDSAVTNAGSGARKTPVARTAQEKKAQLFFLTKGFLNKVVRLLSAVSSLFRESILPSARSRIGEAVEELREFRNLPLRLKTGPDETETPRETGYTVPQQQRTNGKPHGRVLKKGVR